MQKLLKTCFILFAQIKILYKNVFLIDNQMLIQMQLTRLSEVL